MHATRNRLLAEFFGIFWLVFGGCGTAILAASAETGTGVGALGVAIAFGLTVVTMAYAVGHISGGHFNPAVTLGLVAGGRFPMKDAPAYVAVQVIGAIAASYVLYLIVQGHHDAIAAGFASNGFGEHSPKGYALPAAFLTEVVMTAGFLFIIMGATDKRAPAGFAPLAIGLALALIHLISIPVTNTSVNPARSTGVGVFAGTVAIQQLWLFWVAPAIGAVLAGGIWRWLAGRND